jgi:tripartite-type tricarboxylate transporter receptor subunit TctC
MKLTDPGSRTAGKLASVALAFAMLGVWAPRTVQAQSFPAKPVRIIVPAAPGGGIDITARTLSTKLSEIWGQQVYVENKPGANAIVGTEATVKANPDGYTVMLASAGAITINPVAYSNLPYDPQRDLTPVILVSSSPSVLLSSRNLPVNSMQDLLKHLRANPGKLNYASNSASTILASGLLKALAKVDYLDINYKGASLAAGSTASGETDFCIVDMGSAMTFMRGDRVRALAVTTPQRSKLQPNIPTLAESGVPGYSYTANIVLFAPAKVPADIIAKFNADIKKVLAMPDVVSKIEGTGSEVVASNVEETARAMKADTEQWAKLVKERGIKFQ